MNPAAMFAGRVTNALRQSAPRLSASFSSKRPPALADSPATQELFKTIKETAAKLAEEVDVPAPTRPVPFRSPLQTLD